MQNISHSTKQASEAGIFGGSRAEIQSHRVSTVGIVLNELISWPNSVASVFDCSIALLASSREFY